MFGLFYTFANFIGITISGLKESYDNSVYKSQGWERYNNGTDMGKHIYYDTQGRQKDLSTDHLMLTYRENGDLFIKDTKTSEIRNLSNEKRLKELIKIQKENPNITAVFYKHWNNSNSELKDGIFRITGKVFKNVNNGELYFERYITWRKNDFSKPGVIGDSCAAYFYLRISDGKIVSVSDKQKEIDNNTYDEFINFFNSEQDKGGFIIRNRNMYAKGKKYFYLDC